MRLLVCGGAGFIGSAVVRRTLLRNPDWEIACLDKLTYAGNLDNLLPVAEDPRYSFVRADIGDRAAVEAAIENAGGVDAIVNFAAETHVDRSIAEPEAFLQTDILGTHTLLEIVRANDIAKMVQVSTDEVYGSIDDGSFCETARIHPSSPYSASKAGGGLQVLAYHTTFGTPALITRGSNTYGPYQYPEKLIPLFVTNALEGGKLPIYGDGLNVRDWLHVDDHADGIAAALVNGEPGEVYNIGGGNEVPNVELTRRILQLTGKPESLITPVADRVGHDRRYALDTAKLRGLGWKPQVAFADGLRATVEWYRDNGWWWQPIKHNDPAFKAYYQAQYETRTGA